MLEVDIFYRVNLIFVIVNTISYRFLNINTKLITRLLNGPYHVETGSYILGVKLNGIVIVKLE